MVVSSAEIVPNDPRSSGDVWVRRNAVATALTSTIASAVCSTVIYRPKIAPNATRPLNSSTMAAMTVSVVPHAR